MTNLKFIIHVGDSKEPYTLDVEYRRPLKFIALLIKLRGEVVFTTALPTWKLGGFTRPAKFVFNFSGKRHVVVYKPHGIKERDFFKLMESL